MSVIPVEIQSTEEDVEIRSRAVAVAKFRELADRLERYEILGARIQWREGLTEIETVIVTENRAELRRESTVGADAEPVEVFQHGFRVIEGG